MTYLIIGHAKCNASTVTLVTNRCLRKKEKNKILSVIYRHFDTARLKRIGHYLLSLSLIVRDVIHGEKMRQMVSGREKWARKKWTQIKCINWDSFVLRMECCLAIRFGQSTPKMDSKTFFFFFVQRWKWRRRYETGLTGIERNGHFQFGILVVICQKRLSCLSHRIQMDFDTFGERRLRFDFKAKLLLLLLLNCQISNRERAWPNHWLEQLDGSQTNRIFFVIISFFLKKRRTERVLVDVCTFPNKSANKQRTQKLISEL